LSVVALITWVLAALLGFTMLAVWVRNGGHRGASRFAPPL
jgi:hypothetical protein